MYVAYSCNIDFRIITSNTRLTFPPCVVPWKKQHRDKTTKECGGAGGVLDSLLDIVGQCAPSKSGRLKPLALSAGCGNTDARNIRSNCFTLISLLVAVLATKNSSNFGPGPENEKHEINGDHDETPQSLVSDGTRASKPFSYWGGGEFITMKPEPGADRGTTISNQGWEARQPLSRSLGTAGSPGEGRAAVPMAAIISTTHRARHRKKVGVHAVKDRTRARRKTATKRLVSEVGLVEGQRSGQNPIGSASPPPGRVRNRDGQSQRASRIAGTAAVFTEDIYHDDTRAKGGRDSINVNYLSDVTNPGTTEARASLGVKSAKTLPQPEMTPAVPGYPASPPRLSRLKGGERSALHSSSTTTTVAGGRRRASPCAARRTVVDDDDIPLGLSIPGFGERQRRTTVSGTYPTLRLGVIPLGYQFTFRAFCPYIYTIAWYTYPTRMLTYIGVTLFCFFV